MSLRRDTEIFTISTNPDNDDTVNSEYLSEYTSSERSFRRRSAKNVPKRIAARLAVRKVAEDVKESAMLTADYLLYTLFGEFVPKHT